MSYSYGFGLIARRNKTRVSIDFSSIGAGVVALPNWLSFSRASSATVQTSATTVLTSIGVDQARVGDDGAGHRGLVIEEQRANRVFDNDYPGNGWSLMIGVSASGSIVGPDGQTKSLFAYNGGGTVDALRLANVNSPGVATTVYTFSVWENSTTGAQNMRWSDNQIIPMPITIPTVWTRRIWVAPARTGTSNTDPYYEQAAGVNTPFSGLGVSMVQVEQGKFATETITTAGSAATRAGERLWVKDASKIVANGSLLFECSLYPKGAISEYSAPITIWYKDASNYIQLANTGIVSVVVAGVTVTSLNAMVWNANELVEVFAIVGNGVPQLCYRRESGDRVTVWFPATTQASIASSGTIDLLCAGTSSQWTARIRTIKFYRSQQLPSWADSLVYEADFTYQSPGVVTMPSWLSFSRASNATVQTSATTVNASIGVDQARLGDDGAGHRGLVIEEPRTNYQPTSSPSTWTNAGAVITTVTGPAGTSTAGSVEDASATVQAYAANTVSGLTISTVTYIASCWAIDLSAGVGGAISYNTNVVPQIIVNRPLAVWTKFVGTPSVASVTSATSSAVPTTLGNVALLGKAAYEFCQLENGNFPTESIVTTGTAATRAGDRLWIADCSPVMVGGQTSMEVAGYMKGQYTLYKNSQILFFFDGNNSVKITQGFVVVTVNGVALTSTNTYAFNKNDFVEVWVQVGNGIPHASMRVNGGSVIRFTFPATVQDALPTSGSVDLLCASAGGNQFIARVTKIRFYKLNQKPSWV